MKKLFVLIFSYSILPLWATPLWTADNIEYSGFGTIGVVGTDSDFYGYRQDISQTDGAFKHDIDFNSVSVLGLQLNLNINEKMGAVYQTVYHDQNDLSVDSATRMAFLRHSPNAAWSFRAGRTAVDLFLLTEYRDVGFAYTWAQPPKEVYGIVPFRHLDGVDVTYSTRFTDLTLRSKIFTGKSKSDIATFDSFEEYKIDNVLGISFSFEAIDWTIKAQYTTVKVENETLSQLMLRQGVSQIPDVVWPNATNFAEELSVNNNKVKYASLSGRYDLGDWQLLSEFTHINSDLLVIPELLAGYVSIIRRHYNHAGYVIVAFTDSDNFDITSLNVNTALLPPEGLALYHGVDQTMNFYASNQKTLSIGWRWDIRENLAFKVQLDHTKIDEKGGTLWLNRSSTPIPGQRLTPKETVNTLSTNLSFTF